MGRFGLILSLFSALFFSFSANGQDWVEGMQDPNVNFYKVQADFDSHWNGLEIEKGKGWKQFKRWEAFMAPRVYPSGERPNPSILFEALEQIQAQQSVQSGGQWTPLGPTNGNAIDGIGRLNTIAFHPNDPNVFYVGAPAGGLWKTTDGGLSWNTTTDQLTNLGVSGIALHPLNPDTLFIITGDRDASDTYSHGLMKSYNGGQTWLSTGLSFNLTQAVRGTAVHILPHQPNVIVVTTRNGMRRSVDGGDTWTTVQGGGFNSIEPHPTNPNMLFATTYGTPARIHRSTDGGASWTLLNATNGLPNNANRIELATSVSDTNYIYALCSGNDNGFLGMYRSTDRGLTWTLRSSSPNLMGWSTTGNDQGGQGWYDLAVEVDPDNRDIVYTGGVNIWKSTDGGQSWNLNAHWFGGGGAPYVHADIHWLAFQPGTARLFACGDGGLSRTNNGGSSWTELQNGMNITQYYKIGTSASDSIRVIAGAQDNGTHLRQTNLVWDRVAGGDGMDCAIDPANSNIMYSSVYYGDFQKSVNGGNSFGAAFNLPPSGTGNWVTPFAIDPSNGQILYAGFDGIWKSTNGGSSFANVSGSLNGANLDVVYVSPANPQHVFASGGADLYRSTDGAQNFSSLAGALPGSLAVTGVSTHPVDPNKIWVSMSGYSVGFKVYYSSNGGQTWTNLSSGLPNVPVNCVIHSGDTARNGVYIGTDVGVYYRDDLLNAWVPFMNGLPNVIVNELEIQPISLKIRAGTYGRGVWESPLFSQLLRAPEANFTWSSNALCTGDTLFLQSTSLYLPDSVYWEIQPGGAVFVNGTHANSPVAAVVLSAPGWHSISLKAFNALGADSILRVAAVSNGGLPLPFVEDFETTELLERWEIVNPDQSVSWAATQATGANGQQGSSMFLDHYAYNAAGQLDYLVSPPLDFRLHQNVHLQFKHAYALFPGYADSLFVEVSSNCGQSWTRVASLGENGSGNFKTRPDLSTFFSPSAASDWCGQPGFASCNDIDLSAYSGLDDVRVRFVSKTGYGNAFYLDDISIDGAAAVKPVAQFDATVSTCLASAVVPINYSTGAIDSVYWSFPGGSPSASNNLNPTIIYTAPGTYSAELRVYNSLGGDTAFAVQTIQIQPSSPVLAQIVGNGNGCVGQAMVLQSNSGNAGSTPTYQWFKNGMPISGATGDSINISTPVQGDTYYYSIASSLECAFPALAWSDTVAISLSPLPTVSTTAVAPICVSEGPQTLSFGSPAGGVYGGPGVVGNVLYPDQSGSGTKILTYTYTAPNGCSATATRSVQISPVPVVVISPDSSCSDDGMVVLNQALPTGGVYVVNGDTVSSLDPAVLGIGVYAVTYHYGNAACDSSVQSVFEILASPAQPAINVLSNALECSVVGVDYRWFLDGQLQAGFTTQQITPNSAGYYQVEIALPNGCTSISDSVLFSIGLEDFGPLSGLSLFPNPNGGSFSLRVPENAEGYYEIFDARGALIQSGNCAEGLCTMSVSGSSGVYSLRYRTSDSVRVLRFMLE